MAGKNVEGEPRMVAAPPGDSGVVVQIYKELAGKDARACLAGFIRRSTHD